MCRMAHGLTLPAERPSCRALRTISPNVVRSHSGLGSGILWPAGRAACTAAGFFLFSGQNLYQARMTQWRRQWHPTPLLLPGKSHGRRSLVGCSPWGHWESDTTKRLHFHFSPVTHWRRKWHPTPVFLPGESQGWRSLVGCSPWGRTESDTTEAT